MRRWQARPGGWSALTSAGSLAAARERAIEEGITAEMIDDVVAILRAAQAPVDVTP
jgi:hypothetical protein